MAQNQLYNVAGTLNEILIQRDMEARQRAADERQRQLDEQNRLDSEAERAYRAENARSLAEQRKYQNEERALKILDSGVYGQGESLADLDPEILEIGKRYGRVQMTPGGTVEKTSTEMLPNPQGETEGTLDETQVTNLEVTPDRPTYRGTPAERAAARKREQFGKVLPALLDPELSPVERLLMLQQASGDIDVSDVSRLLVTQAGQQPQYVLDEATGKITQAVDPTTGKPIYERPVIRNRPPNPPAGTQPFLYQVPGPDGKMRSHWLRPGEQPSEANAIRAGGDPLGGVRRGNEPTQSSRMPELITPAEQTKLSALMTQAQQGWGSRNKRALSNYVATLLPGLERKVSDPSVIQAVKGVLQADAQDPKNRALSTEEVMKRIQSQSPDMTPQEAMELESLLGLLRLRQ